jgi:hypothetical protein
MRKDFKGDLKFKYSPASAIRDFALLFSFLSTIALLVVASMAYHRAYSIDQTCSCPSVNGTELTVSGITFSNAYVTNMTNTYPNISSEELNLQLAYRFESVLLQDTCSIDQHAGPLVIEFVRNGLLITASVRAWTGYNASSSCGQSFETQSRVPEAFIPKRRDLDLPFDAPQAVFANTNFDSVYGIGTMRLKSTGVIFFDASYNLAINWNGTVSWSQFSTSYSRLPPV